MGRSAARRVAARAVHRWMPSAGAFGLVLWLLAQPSGHASPLAEAVGATPDLEQLLARPGPALRAGVDAMARGEPLVADALLAAVAERHAVIADHADLLRLELRVESGRYHEAIDLRERWSYPNSPIVADFYTLLGRAYAEAGDPVQARSVWDFAAHATRDRERQAALRLAIAESLREEGAPDQVAEALLAVWSHYPETPEARRADASLRELERQLGHSVRGASDQRRRADALYARRYNEEALAAYDQALALGLSGSEREAARHDRAQTLFRLRRYTEAARAFEALPATDERRIQHARALARAGRVTEGARELEKIGASSRGAQGTRALLLAALLWDGDDDARARENYAMVIRRDPRSGYAGAAFWRLGWAAYREGRYAEAIDYFEKLEENEDDPIAALRPRYWIIRADEQLGDARADHRYAALAREYPLSYYGWRARERTRADASLRALKEIHPGRAALAPEQLARPRILLEAGLTAEARAELDHLFRRARGLEDRLALAQLYANAGDFHQPQRLMVDAYTEWLARGPLPDQLDLWWHAWPVPFEEEMRGATLDGIKIEPELVYSVMREESGYRPQVVSVSGARGLLQLMPETAERVARDAQLEAFSVDDLFEPRINIQLGSDYLSSLLRRFDGRESAAIGGYNAGPHVVARWVSDTPGEDDVWVEDIPYDQTRAYVKRVLRSLHAYRVLY